MRKVGLLSLAILCLLSPSPMMTLAQEDGIIQGSVVNGTANGGSAEGLDVVLRVFRGRNESESLTTTADTQGLFRFENLNVGSDWVYLVQVPYKGVVYSRGMLAFEAGKSELATEVAIYETTTSNAGICVERAHLFITVADASLSVTEMYVFVNPTDRTYVGTQEIQGRRWTFRFLLPRESHNLAFDDGSLGGRFLSREGGFVDTEPQWPGSTSVMFTYVLDCQAGVCDLVREVTHLISNLNVLIPDTGVKVESKKLTFQGKMEAQGQPYLNYVGRDLVPGEKLDLRVRLPQAVSASAASRKSSSQALPWIISGGVVIALILAYPFWKRRVQAAARERK